MRTTPRVSPADMLLFVDMVRESSFTAAAKRQSFGLKGAFCPTILHLFHGSR